jgi:hypothetical protein
MRKNSEHLENVFNDQWQTIHLNFACLRVWTNACARLTFFTVPLKLVLKHTIMSPLLRLAISHGINLACIGNVENDMDGAAYKVFHSAIGKVLNSIES